MNVLTAGKIQRAPNDEHEVDVLQALSILEYLVLDRVGVGDGRSTDKPNVLFYR